MTAPPAGASTNIGLFRMLECAVILNWEDLMQAVPSGSIHIEYAPGLNGSLESLQIWSSKTRGYWNLVCEYWMDATPSHASGLSFHNGYHSRCLAQMLDFAMQHQNTVSLSSELDFHGLMQIHAPTEEEGTAADTSMREAAERAGLARA